MFRELSERIKEVVDFAKAESPYRAANKGWLTDDIYLQRGPSKSNSTNQFDQLVKVSFLWQPIVQIAITIFFVIALSTIFAFTPLAFINGRFQTISSLVEFKPIQLPKESLQIDVQRNNEFQKTIINELEEDMVTKENSEPDTNVAAKTNKDIKTDINTAEKPIKENNAGLILRF